MRPILTPGMRSVLQSFSTGKVLVAFDFDGTLAPIVEKPATAAMRASTRTLLRQLATVYPCIVVSGRSRDDVGQKVRGVPLRECIGNHGIEPWETSTAASKQVEAWIPVLRARFASFSGIRVENKRYSLSIHYRGVRGKKKALKAIVGAGRSLEGARILAGKQVLNILPCGAPGKGLAVEQARRKFRCDKVIYAGDDVTDEDVFALAKNGRFLTIRVGANRRSVARFYLRSQREMDRLLKTLIEFRGA